MVTTANFKADSTVPMDEFVSIQRPAADPPPPARFTLALTNGDRLPGEFSAVAGEKLIWTSPTLGKVPIPFSRLAAIGKGDGVILPDEPPKQDVVTLANGDTAAGVFTGYADGNVTIQTDAGATSIPLANVSRIAFASTGAPAADTARAFRIHLLDGSTITVRDASIDGEQLKLTLPGKNAGAVSIALASVLGIEQINGPVSWLSSHVPTENIQTPYLGEASHWPARFDLAVDGSPLSFDGKIFDRGIGVHAYSRLTFAVDPQWATFRTQYCIESHRDDPARYADVTVRLKVDGKVVHEQQHVRAGELYPVVSISLKGASTLTLECDYGTSGDTQARLNWIQPALLRPQPPIMPPIMPPITPATAP